MSELHRLEITLPPDHAGEDGDMLRAVLALCVSHGWEEESLPTGELRCIVHFVLPEPCVDLSRRLPDLLPGVHLNASCVRETNWVEAWKEYFTPVTAGAFLVLAPWMREELAATALLPVVIEPKTAFGTGHHATTALCLEALSLLYGRKLVQAGMRFLDLGTGSGILGIACAKLGLTGDGLDIETASIANAEENRAINGIDAHNFALHLGSVELASGPYHLIMANILAQPLMDMAAPIAALPGPFLQDGKTRAKPLLVLSGLLDIQAGAVEQAYLDQGFSRLETLCRDEWRALLFTG